MRSILLTKAMRGTPYLSACRQTVSDCGSTPATESKSAIAPSSTLRLRSTSTVKSTCPGVSMMLIRCCSGIRLWRPSFVPLPFFSEPSIPPQKTVVAALVMVIPRSRSWDIQSITALPSWTSPNLWVRPVYRRIRSVVVVLPASICAMIPMFRTRRSGVFLATCTAIIGSSSPSVVCERPVGLCHPVGIFLALHAGADVVLGVQDLACEPAAHRLLASGAGEAHHPAQGERVRPPRGHLDGHLVGRAADPPATYPEARLDVVEGVVQDGHRVRAGALLDEGEGIVDDLFGDALLTVEHDLVDQLLHKRAPVDGIGGDLPLRWGYSPRHLLSSSYAFFVPYLERPCLRSLTPRVSS